MLVLQETGLS